MPGLDLLRLLIVAPDTAKFDHPGGNIVDLLLVGAIETETPAENHVMMATRLRQSLFASSEGRALAVKEFEKIQDTVSTAIKSSTNRNLLVAATTVYINYAVLFLSDKDNASFEHVLAIVDTLSKILSSQADSEVIFRALVATGTILYIDDEVKSAAKDVYGIEKSISTALAKATDPRIKNAAREIRELLK